MSTAPDDEHTPRPTTPPTTTPLDPPPAPEPSALQRRLRALLAIRCGLVTLLLGSALAVNINNAASFDNPAYQGLISVIIATYAMTVGGALWLRSGRRLEALAVASYLVDALLAAALVLLTGRLESPFTYLFLLVALAGGVIAGRRGGTLAAICATVGITLVLAFELGLVTLHWAQPFSGAPSPSPWFRSVLLATASLGIGLLSGILRERLETAASSLVASEREVAALRSLHERILDSLRAGVVTADARGVVTFANPAALALLGRPVERVLGAPLAALGLAPPVRPGEELRWECEILRGDGEPSILGVSIANLERDGHEGAGDVLTFQDLTALRRIQRQLAQQERLATVGRFAASIAHEIRNPLASISGSVELLGSSSALEGDDATLIRIVSTEIDRLNRLVRAILDYAGPRSVMLGQVDVGQLLQDLRLMFAHDPLTRDLELSLTVPDSPVVAAADPEVVRQIVLNLWRNAAQAVVEHGVAAGRVHTTLTQMAHVVVLRVEDNGPGVPEGARERIFEPFYSTRDGGTGLGLATVFQLAAEMDGSVQLLMEHDESFTLDGAAFEVRLPRADRGVGQSSSAATSSAPQEQV